MAGFVSGDNIPMMIQERLEKNFKNSVNPLSNSTEWEKNNGGDIAVDNSDDYETICTGQDDIIQSLGKQEDVGVEISPGEIMITDGYCGVILTPREIRHEQNFIIVILDMNSQNRFILKPGTKFDLYYNNIDENIIKNVVFYSGITFDYEKNLILVFHSYTGE